MPYLNTDDGMDEHPKIEALTDAAYRLLMASMHYAARNLTDGYLSLSKARRLTVSGKDPVASELVKAGVWHDLGEGCTVATSVEAKTCHPVGRQGHYIIHDYLQWNHSKAWWEKRRRDDAERRKKYLARKNKGRVDD